MSARMTRRDFLKYSALLPLGAAVRGRASALGRVRDGVQDRQRPNVLVFVFDALCAKHLSLYGYSRETTPNLGRFSEKATVYHTHYAGGNFTPPGTASLLTGTYPWSHRALHHAGTVIQDFESKSLFSAFAAQGYRTYVYTQNLWANLLLNQFDQDLTVHLDPGEFCLVDGLFYDRLFPRDENTAHWVFEDLLFRRHKIPGALFSSLVQRAKIEVHERSLEKVYSDLYPRGVPVFSNLFFVLEQAIDGIHDLLQKAPTPFLGYFHLMPPHGPYWPRREFVGLFDDRWQPVSKAPSFASQGHPDAYLNRKRREYDEYIAYVDAEFGRLLDALENEGALDHTYLIFTSDHGEMFERGILAHETPTLYDPVIRIPLLISGPGHRTRQDVYMPTSAVDLVPTMLSVIGQPSPPWCEGQVLPAFAGAQADAERSIFVVEAKSNHKQRPLTKGTVALIKGQHKLICYLGYRDPDAQYELYDLATDPEEMQDLYSTSKTLASSLRGELEEKLRAVNQQQLAREESPNGNLYQPCAQRGTPPRRDRGSG